MVERICLSIFSRSLRQEIDIWLHCNLQWTFGQKGKFISFLSFDRFWPNNTQSAVKKPFLYLLGKISLGQCSHIQLDQLTGLELGIEGFNGLFQACNAPWMDWIQWHDNDLGSIPCYPVTCKQNLPADIASTLKFISSIDWSWETQGET